MISATDLLLNQELLGKVQEPQKPLFILHWLNHLNVHISSISRNDIKQCQKQLIEQLFEINQNGPGPATRSLIASSLATIFSIGDTLTLFDTVNKLNDTLKSRDDSPTALAVKLAAMSCLAEMYSKLGRMMGRSYEETIQILNKSFRNMESQLRIETMVVFEKICSGMDSAASTSHKEMYKIARLCLTDRVMSVRISAAKCLMQMMNSASFMYTTELDSFTTLCFRGLDGADYDARIVIATLLGYTISCTQSPPNLKARNAPMAQSKNGVMPAKPMSLEESLNVLMTGFLKNGKTNREVRVGITHAYISFIENMGPIWLERHLDIFTSHVLDLVANPKAATSHVDCVYARKCVNFILRRTFGRLLSEKAQFSAVKCLAAVILKQMNSIDFDPENAKECNQEIMFNQHLLVCALHELAALFLNLSTSVHHFVTDSSSKTLDGIFSVLVHPCHSTRLAGAWTLRCLCIACPSEAHKSIERCLTAFELFKSSPEAISGYSAALAAILGAVRSMPLGVPYATGKIVFNTAEELLRSASQNSRLSLQKTAAGWLLIGSIATLGNNVVKALLPRMSLLWRNSFPKTAKELESEKARGDAFTWQVTLEGRAGALSAIHSFLLHCPDLVNDEVISKLLVPIESALAMMTNLSATLKTYGQQLKSSAALLRFRLYKTIGLIKPSYFERSYTHMLRFVIWELTLNENAANTTTSLFSKTCQSNSIFNPTLSDHAFVEDQLQLIGAAGSGAIEHDPCSLFINCPEGSSSPSPLPLGVAVIDASIELFAKLYPHISTKHRAQLIEHFVDCLKVNKYARKDAVLINIFCAILSALKCLRKLNTTSQDLFDKDLKRVEPEELKALCQQLVIMHLGHPNTSIRCAATEVLGRIIQAVGESKYTSEMAQLCTDTLKMSKDAGARTGHALALGNIHKYLGGMDSSRHQHASVSVLINLAQDGASPETQTWALHSLSLVADTGGPLFRPYVEPTLSLVLKLIMTVHLSAVELRQAAGKMMASLITGVGPELQVGGDKDVEKIRKLFETGYAILSREAEHYLVQSEAVTCFQRLHLFGGNIKFDMIVPVLYRSLSCPNLTLRRTAIDCFRQLSQRDADLVCKHVSKLLGKEEDNSWTEYGLTGALFIVMDRESDEVLVKGIKDTLTSVLLTVIHDYGLLQSSISLCKTILTADTGTAENSNEEAGDDFEDDDVGEFKIGNEEATAAANAKYNSRWTSRVFAAECVRKILITSPCITNQTGAELVRHLSDLIRMSFMGATSNSDPLRLEGLLNLETVIEKFAELEDPDFPGTSILEQFQAQVSSALRPAFSVETDPYVRATACRVCSAWICGNSRGGEDLRRVHTLMVSALENIKAKPTLPDYNEKANTLEKLAVLKAWAKVFITAVKNGLRSGESLSEILKLGVKTKNHLLELVKPEIARLSPLWLSALKDRALIELPAEYSSQIPREGGAFFSNETKDLVQSFYNDAWPPILMASSLCVSTLPDLVVRDEEIEDSDQKNQARSDRFYLVFGLSMEALCKPTFSEDMESVEMYLTSLWALFSSEWPRTIVCKEQALAIELCSVLHRQLVTRSDIKVQTVVMQILKLLVEGMSDSYNKISRDQEAKEADETEEDEGHQELVPGKSIVLSILEVVFCLLMQKIPTLNSNVSGFLLSQTGTDSENDALTADAIHCLEAVLNICSDNAASDVQPTILYLVTCAMSVNPGNLTSTAVLNCFRKILRHKLKNDSNWEKFILSTLVKLLDLTKTAGSDSENPTNAFNQLQLLQAISVFLKESPPGLVKLPNIIYPSINLCQQALKSDNETVRIKSMSAVAEIFEHADLSVSTPFIHALAPGLLQFLNSEDARNVQSKPKLELTLEAIKTIQILLQIVDNSEKRSVEEGIQMLMLIVPVLIKFLLEPSVLISANPYKKVLHEVSLHKLMKIGPQYPQEFRKLMSQATEMRTKLETAIKYSRSNNKLTETNGQTNLSSLPTIPTSGPGSIILKTDFSNFTK